MIFSFAGLRGAFKDFGLAVSLAIVASGPVAAQGMGAASKDAGAVPAGHYELDRSHTQLIASVDHMGFSTTHVTFKKVAGSFDYDPAQLAASTLNITIDAASLDSGFEMRDKDLKGPQFFNAAAFPTITYKATGLKKLDATHAVIEGNLTLLGVTRPVALNVTFNGLGTGMMKETRVGFTAKAGLRRSDFGMKTFIPIVGDEVEISIDAEASKK